MGFENLTDPVNRAVAASLGIPATWTPNGSGSPVTFRAVFQREHAILDPETGMRIATAQSAAMIRAADLPREPIEDDALSIGGFDFLVAGIEPDGQGGILLVLERAPTP